MRKKTNARTLIRKIVREEVAMAIGEVVNELKSSVSAFNSGVKTPDIIPNNNIGNKGHLFIGTPPVITLIIIYYSFLLC